MSVNTKALRNRLKSINSTMHLTKAMGLVASSKIRRATENMLNGREYKKAASDVAQRLFQSSEFNRSVYTKSFEGGATKLIAIAGDRGLAGGYNANVFRMVNEVGFDEIYPIGKRSCEKYNREPNLVEKFSFSEAKALAKSLCGEFAERKTGRVGIVCTKYVTMLTQIAVTEWILPIPVVRSEGRGAGLIFEPDANEIAENIAITYVAAAIVSAVKESFCCEVISRRAAMDSAGRNAREMMENLQLAYNSARQAAITQELTEITAGDIV